ncbi:MAG: hypothetical protein M1826_003872 [Phylliscum demangeonii]|nr:MAG: hypothetical protein M1826_003872 [Phylliscum demangeonii]
MGKRKRHEQDANVASPIPSTTTLLQVVAGSYEGALQGLTATICNIANSDTTEPKQATTWADAFLFDAHSAAVRCLAVSTPHASKRMLASGGADEKINLYHLSTAPPLPQDHHPDLDGPGDRAVAENELNKEMGGLLHHAAPVTALAFSTRSKLFSAAEDNVIAIARTRDWTVLKAIKAPLPPTMGRPMGDTAAFGALPAGINHFAIHPSRKLMLSVSRGEKCMRLWNLVTGKKAGVLTFDKELLRAVGERRHTTGEAHKVDWNAEGDQFAVAFDRGVVVYGLDCRPRCHAGATPPSKIHQIRYLKLPGDLAQSPILTLSTEDGRLLFCSTSSAPGATLSEAGVDGPVPAAPVVAEMGGKSVGVTARIRDFVIVDLKPAAADEADASPAFLVVTGSSDGSIRLWSVDVDDLQEGNIPGPSTRKVAHATDASPRQIGRLLGRYDTRRRISCLAAFPLAAEPGGPDAVHEAEGASSDGKEAGDAK